MRQKSYQLSNHEKELVTCIENFANELFYEIFDYLDGCEIYHSFSNLNHRFQDILSSSALRLKLSLSPFLDTDTQHACMRIISQRKKQILSLRLMHTLIPLDSSFTRLESLVIIGVNSDNLIQHLFVLISLPCLQSLILCINYHLENFREMYRLIFELPVLKYIKFSSDVYEPSIPLSIATNDQFSSIEYLIIDHSCNFNDIISILSYTPRLRWFRCRELIRSMTKVLQETITTTIHLPNLTFISISECYEVFDLFESFLKRIICPLQILRVNTYWDANYLNTYRWEQLFVRHMPYLNEFCLQHHEFMDDDFQITQFHTLINEFYSSFWNTQDYTCELTIDANDVSWTEIIYSIRPRRKSEHHSRDIKLTINAPLSREFDELFTDNILSLLTLLKITRLNITQHQFSLDILIDLLHHLPDLHTLSIQKSLCIPDGQVPVNRNKITKINNLYLLDRYPNIRHLQIDGFDNIDLKPFLSLTSLRT